MNREDVWRGFDEALAGHPFNSIETLADELSAGLASIVVGARSAVFVRWDMEARVAECGPATGDVREIITELRPVIEAHAASLGLDSVLIQAGRMGWSRALRAHGYEEAAVILRKRIDGA